MEERNEVMLPSLSSSPSDATPRLAHFLHPTIQTSPPHLSSLPPSSPLPPLKVTFQAWTKLQKDWNTWLNQMKTLHKSTWLKSGIHDAIINSTFTINKIEHLILKFVENWCCETNTFIFPFGEVTITLEDVSILGGFSILGESLDSTEIDEVSEKLEQARLELVRTSAHVASHNQWMLKFFGSGSKIEHAAFLLLWLSKFVFPSSKCVINKDVIHIASRLSQGCKFALAPAVLAAIYRDLSFLKHAIVDKESSISALGVFQLVQLWIWERFPNIRPNPNPNLAEGGKPRFARWHDCKSTKFSVDLESCSEGFQWRPYCKDMKTSTEDGWVLFDCSRDDMVEFSRICRASILVGLKCVEQYLPHRTARQLGFDQDVPSDVQESKKAPKVAWRNYTRPVLDKKLYFPSRCFEAGVTMRFFQWWNEKFGSENINVKKRKIDDEGEETIADFLKKRVKIAEPLQSSVSSSPYNEPVQIKHVVENVRKKNEVKIEHIVEDVQKNLGCNLHLIALRARVLNLEKDLASIKSRIRKESGKR